MPARNDPPETSQTDTTQTGGPSTQRLDPGPARKGAPRRSRFFSELDRIRKQAKTGAEDISSTSVSDRALTEAERSRAEARTGLRLLGDRLLGPWILPLIPALGPLCDWLLGDLLILENAFVAQTTQLPLQIFPTEPVALAAAYLAGRRWGAAAGAPVLFLCLWFVLRIVSPSGQVFAPGNLFMIPAILLMCRLGASPDWLSRLRRYGGRMGWAEIAGLGAFLALTSISFTAFSGGDRPSGAVSVSVIAGGLAWPVIAVMYAVMQSGVDRRPALALVGLSVLALFPGLWLGPPPRPLSDFATGYFGMSPVLALPALLALYPAWSAQLGQRLSLRSWEMLDTLALITAAALFSLGPSLVYFDLPWPFLEAKTRPDFGRWDPQVFPFDLISAPLILLLALNYGVARGRAGFAGPLAFGHCLFGAGVATGVEWVFIENNVPTFDPDFFLDHLITLPASPEFLIAAQAALAATAGRYWRAPEALAPVAADRPDLMRQILGPVWKWAAPLACALIATMHLGALWAQFEDEAGTATNVQAEFDAVLQVFSIGSDLVLTRLDGIEADAAVGDTSGADLAAALAAQRSAHEVMKQTFKSGVQDVNARARVGASEESIAAMELAQEGVVRQYLDIITRVDARIRQISALIGANTTQPPTGQEIVDRIASLGRNFLGQWSSLYDELLAADGQTRAPTLGQHPQAEEWDRRFTSLIAAWTDALNDQRGLLPKDAPPEDAALVQQAIQEQQAMMDGARNRFLALMGRDGAEGQPQQQQAAPTVRVVTGLNIRAGCLIDAIQPIYTEIGADGSFGERTLGPFYGETGGNPITFETPGYLVHELRMTRGDYRFGGVEVIHLQVVFRRLVDGRMTPEDEIVTKRLGEGCFSSGLRPETTLTAPADGYFTDVSGVQNKSEYMSDLRATFGVFGAVAPATKN